MEQQSNTESFNTQSNAENTNNSNSSKEATQLIEQVPMKNAPILITRVRQSSEEEFGEYFGMVAGIRVTEYFSEKEELISHIDDCGIKNWSTVIAVTAAHIVSLEEYKKINNN